MGYLAEIYPFIRGIHIFNRKKQAQTINFHILHTMFSPKRAVRTTRPSLTLNQCGKQPLKSPMSQNGSEKRITGHLHETPVALVVG